MYSAVTMSPDSQIMWRSTEVNNGTLYLPQEPADDRNISLALSTNTGKVLPSCEDHRDKVYLPPEGQPQDVVIKEFTAARPRGTASSGLEILRAHVMFEAGLSVISQEHPWRIRSPKILSAFVAQGQGTPGLPRARFVMERANPDPTLDPSDLMQVASHSWYRPPAVQKRRPVPDLPDVEQRKDLYRKALLAVGGHGAAEIFWDDQRRNMILESPPARRLFRENVQGVATKIDINPITGFDF